MRPSKSFIVLLIAICSIPACLQAQTCTTAPQVTSLWYGGNGCTGTSSAPDPNPCQLPGTIYMNGYLTQGFRSCDTYTWNFGDGSAPTHDTYTSHNYATAGTYTVTFNASNSVGQSLMSMTVKAGYVIGLNYGGSFTEGGTAIVTVSRGYSGDAASVQYSTSNGTAKAGVNYTATSGTLSFASGETSKSFTVPLLHDNVYTGTLQFNANISNPSSGYVIGQSSTTVSINDIEPPPSVGFSATSYDIQENGGPQNITIQRKGDMSGSVTASYYVQSGAVQPVSGSVTFGPNETTKTFAVTPINDSIYTGTRSSYMYISTSTGTTFNYSAYVYVHDDEAAPTVTVSDISIVEGDSGTSNATFTATLSEPLTISFSLYYSTQGDSAAQGVDFQYTSNYVTFGAGETKKTFSVPVFGDTTVEANETFRVTLQISGYGYPVLTRNYAICTILNDDAGMGPAEMHIPTGSTSNLTIRLAQPANAPSTISVASASPSVAGVSDVQVNGGEQNVTVRVKGLQPGTSTVRATLPANLGGDELASKVFVYDPVTLNVSPSALTIPLLSTAVLTLSLTPALSGPTTITIQPSGAGVLDVPLAVVIPPGESTTVNVKALKRQPAILTLTMPAQYGSTSVGILVDIIDQSTLPYITQVSPANGPASGGTAVTVIGANFAAPCSLTFGGSAATDVTVKFLGTITATTPAHAAGPANVVLTCGSSPAYTFTNGFTYLSSSPTLGGITPAFGSVTGGTLVRISGSNLRSGCGVFFDGTSARGVMFEGPTSLTAITPPHGEASVDLSLRCNSDSASLKNAFSYTSVDDPTPSIASIDPLFAAPGQPVTLTGSRFRAGDAITFGNYPAAVLSTTPDKHVVRVPEMPVGKVSINLTDPNQRLTTTGPIFSVLEPLSPQITSISPATGAAGSEIVIDGRGFRPPYSFGLSDHEALVVSLAFDRAVIRVPHDFAAGSYPVSVLNAMNQIASVGPSFTVTPSGPSIDSVTPGCATTDGRVAVVIRGSGFVSGATVSFDGNAATDATVVDAHSINVTAPAGAVGVVKVTVKNPDGASASLSDGFRYVSMYDADGGCAARPRSMRH